MGYLYLFTTLHSVTTETVDLVDRLTSVCKAHAQIRQLVQQSAEDHAADCSRRLRWHSCASTRQTIQRLSSYDRTWRYTNLFIIIIIIIIFKAHRHKAGKLG